MGKKRSKIWKSVRSLVHFLDSLERKKLFSLRNVSLAVQRLKHSFVSNLWGWNNMYIGEEISSLIRFFGVASFKMRG